MVICKVRHILPQQLIEHAPLVISDDAIADG
jgi:hypothetical protein